MISVRPVDYVGFLLPLSVIVNYFNSPIGRRSDIDQWEAGR